MESFIADHRRRGLRRSFDELHIQILAGDTEAANRICILVRAEVVRQLRSQFPREPSDVIETAFDDTLMKYLRRTGLYVPERGDPIAWLVAMGRNCVRNERRSRGRRLRLLGRWLELQEQPTVGAETADLAGTEVWLQERALILLDLAKSAPELRFIQAKLAGASDEALAAIMQLDSGDIGDHHRAVRRQWKTILRRLNRRQKGQRVGNGESACRRF